MASKIVRLVTATSGSFSRRNSALALLRGPSPSRWWSVRAHVRYCIDWSLHLLICFRRSGKSFSNDPAVPLQASTTRSLHHLLRRSVHTSMAAAASKPDGICASGNIGDQAKSEVAAVSESATGHAESPPAAVPASASTASSPAPSASQQLSARNSSRVQLLVKRLDEAEWVVMYAPRDAPVSLVKERIVRKLQLHGLRLDEIRLNLVFDRGLSSCDHGLVELKGEETLQNECVKAIGMVGYWRSRLAPDESKGETWSWSKAYADVGKRLAELEEEARAAAKGGPRSGSWSASAYNTYLEHAVETASDAIKRLRWCVSFYSSDLKRDWDDRVVAEAEAALQLPQPSLPHVVERSGFGSSSGAASGAKATAPASTASAPATAAAAAPAAAAAACVRIEPRLRIVVTSTRRIAASEAGAAKAPPVLQPPMERFRMLPLPDAEAVGQPPGWQDPGELPDWFTDTEENSDGEWAYRRW